MLEQRLISSSQLNSQIGTHLVVVMSRFCLDRAFAVRSTISCLLKRTKATSVTAPAQQNVANSLKDNQNTNVKPFEAIPGPRSLPGIGSTWIMFKSTDPIILHSYLYQKYGDICALKDLIGLGDSILIFNVKDIEMMFRNEGIWPKREGFKSMAYYRNVIRRDVFGDIEGLLSSNDEPWADFRSKVNPILMQPRTAQQYLDSINAVADDFIERTIEFTANDTKNEMPVDYLDELHKWALESIGVIALDKRLGCIDKIPSEESAKLGKYMLETFVMTYTLDYSPMGYFCKKFNLPVWKRFIEYQDFFTNKTLELIEEAIEKVEADPNYAQKSENEKSAFEKLRTKGKILSVVMTLDMLAAGIDTTGKISAAALYNLASNKDKQQKLREEINRVLPGPSDAITKDALANCQYLRAVIKETMRISPVVAANMRKMTKDVTLSGYHIPKGVSVIIPHLYLSMNDQHYTKPNQFIPERWLRDHEESELKVASPFVSMPFGFGPRSCIGKRLANLELEVLIAKMIKNFDLSWNYKPMTFGQDLLYGIKDPLRLQMTRIKS